MNKIWAFSLAEALITLLIVSLIMIAAAPVITKKTKQKSELTYWSTTHVFPNSIMPVNNKNIVLGKNKSSTNSIVVSGVLEFKNKKGETIGWISEDGSSSFDCHCSFDAASESSYASEEILKNQQKIFELISMLQSKIAHTSKNSKLNNLNEIQDIDVTDEQIQSYINDIINSMNKNR